MVRDNDVRGRAASPIRWDVINKLTID